MLLPTAGGTGTALSALLPCAGGLGPGTGCGAGYRRSAGRGWCLPHTGENTCLFPVSGNEVNISPGRRFMIDLPVGSLMADEA